MSNKEMTTEKRLKVRLYLSLLVYTVVGYGLTLILDYIFSKFDNGIFCNGSTGGLICFLFCI